MADLDDFFAKKDKKKSKTKRFGTAEEVAKKLDDTSKRPEPPKPRKDRLTNSNVDGDDSTNSEQRQDDEWKEFEEEERKDYTGLKIGQLNVNDDDDLDQGHGDQGDNGNDGGSDGDENGEGGKSGAWKKVVSPEDVDAPAPVDTKPTTVAAASKVYISPALRNQPLSRAVKARNRTAPDITNEDYFPTLGAARPEEQRKKKNEPAFEEVRHGGRITRVQEIQNASVAVGNRFKSLEDDDS